MQKQMSSFGLLTMAVSSGVMLKAMGAPPNVELLMPFILGAGLVFGSAYGFVVGLLARAGYDVYMGYAGVWTLYTAPAYGIVGILAGLFGVYKKSYNRVQMTLIAALLTVIYDILTMLCFAMQFGMPLEVAFVGQIPFTAMHLLGNCVFVFAICPSLVKFIQADEARAPTPYSEVIK